MTSQFPAVTLRLTELFAAPYRFFVPLYQRPYSWEVRQASQLLNDVLGASGLHSGGSGFPYHFFGTILLMDKAGQDAMPRASQGGSHDYDVVDGQQRLVTLSILLSVMRDLDPTGSAGKTIERMVGADQQTTGTRQWRIKPTAADQHFLDSYVLLPGATAKKPEEELSEAQGCMLAVRDYFVTEFKSLQAAERQTLLNYLERDCYFVVIIPREIDSAIKLFITVNERGKKLSRNDILKADILNGLQDGDIVSAAQTWDQVASELGGDFESFFSHVRSAYGYTKPQIVSAVRAIVGEEGGSKPFISNVFVPMSSAYLAICNAGQSDCKLPGEVRSSLIYLNRLRDGDWAPSAMLVLKMYGQNSANARTLIAEIDRLAYVLRFLCLGTGKRHSRFAAVAKAIRSGKAIDGDHEVFAVTREEAEQVAFHFKDLYRRSQHMCKLLLARLDDAMAGTTPVLALPDLTCEHVMPCRPSANSDWKRVIPDAAEREAATASLGNMVLIGQKHNDKASNLPFERKRDIYISSLNGANAGPLLRSVLDATAWGPGEIAAREAEFMALASKIFRLDFENIKPKKKSSFWKFAKAS